MVGRGGGPNRRVSACTLPNAGRFRASPDPPPLLMISLPSVWCACLVTCRSPCSGRCKAGGCRRTEGKGVPLSNCCVPHSSSTCQPSWGTASHWLPACPPSICGTARGDTRAEDTRQGLAASSKPPAAAPFSGLRRGCAPPLCARCGGGGRAACACRGQRTAPPSPRARMGGWAAPTAGGTRLAGAAIRRADANEAGGRAGASRTRGRLSVPHPAAATTGWSREAPAACPYVRALPAPCPPPSAPACFGRLALWPPRLPHLGFGPERTPFPSTTHASIPVRQPASRCGSWRRSPSSPPSLSRRAAV